MNRHFRLAPVIGLSRRLSPALCLAWALAGPSAQAAEGAQATHDSGVNEVRGDDRGPDARPDAQPGATPPAAPDPQPEPSPPPLEPARAQEIARPPEPTADSSAFVQGQDSQAFMAPVSRKPARTKAQTRLSGLAVMAARLANQARLSAAGTFEAPRDMVNPSERQILLRRPEQTVQPPKPERAPPPASMGVLDENIVKEIGQRKTMFRMCYESARRRGVTVTRADVKWILSPDGSVRDVVVEVAQDEILARCIRVIASRPFPTTVAQEIPVSVPLLFVSER